MSAQSKPAYPTPDEAEEIKVRKARLEELRQGQMRISTKEHALRLQFKCAIAKEEAIQRALGAANDQPYHACSAGLWEQYQATQQEPERQQLILRRHVAVRRVLEEEIKGVHAEWVAMEQETVAIWEGWVKSCPFPLSRSHVGVQRRNPSKFGNDLTQFYPAKTCFSSWWARGFFRREELCTF